MSTKRLELKLYGSLRDFGLLPTAQLTDIRTMVTSIQRELARKGRQFSLAPERVAAVDEALLQSPFGSVDGLRKQMQIWHEGAEWGAQSVNEWYTEERAVAYHAHNQVSQSVLACAAANMSGAITPFLLDLGCGTGLSSHAFLNSGRASFVVGVDLSEGMLRTARKQNRKCDWIVADMSQPLPFRQSAFDGATSIGVLHYLLQDAEGHNSKDRLCRLFFNIRSCVQSCTPVVLQFFPRREHHDAWAILDIARSCGLTAELVCDHCYHTEAMRWFLWVHSSSPFDPSSAASILASCSVLRFPETSLTSTHRSDDACALFQPRDVMCCLALAKQARLRGLPSPTLTSEHVTWLQNDHVKFARQLIRKLNKFEAGDPEGGVTIQTRKRKQDECTASNSGHDVGETKNDKTLSQDHESHAELSGVFLDLARRLRAHYGGKITLEELKNEPFDELYTMLHGG